MARRDPEPAVFPALRPGEDERDWERRARPFVRRFAPMPENPRLRSAFYGFKARKLAPTLLLLLGLVLLLVGSSSLSSSATLFGDSAIVGSLPVTSIRYDADGKDVAANVLIGGEEVRVDFSGTVSHPIGEPIAVRYVEGDSPRALVASVKRERYEGSQWILVSVGLGVLVIVALWRPFFRRMAVRKYMPEALAALKVGNPLPPRVDV
ncbi:hypothetical protein ACIQTZ_14000 [Paenarthrobacter sp. NPDC090520]|uniref:hypothetical protein n=1 Tax=Paenarthrobacter sp. NPDC090520 TaxID=3364382 RepID=UPI00382C0663